MAVPVHVSQCFVVSKHLAFEILGGPTDPMEILAIDRVLPTGEEVLFEGNFGLCK
jgi:hypothetical protein